MFYSEGEDYPVSAKTGELTWANVDLKNPREMAAFRKQQAQRAGNRIRAAVKELQEKGILDENARRIRQDVPPLINV
ncbi:MAG TPA: hypothetical protein DEQ47_02250 [Solibacterales bacterium]|jgi:hypothetical protein|nr:hypothetical protein [Bryobacterales bacterium]